MIRSSLRLVPARLRVLAAVVLAVGAAKGVEAASSLPAVPVAAVQATPVADLVLLGRGFDAGLREGMICRIHRGATEVAEVLLVGLRPTAAAALILRLAPRQAIRPGDTATLKILKT